MKNLLIISAYLMALCSTFAQTSPTAAPNSSKGYHLLKKTVVGGNGFWDYLTVDQASNRLFLSHNTRVEVLDLKTHNRLDSIPNTQGVHGIAIAAKVGRGFTTNGRTNTATMFDLKTLKPISEVPTGKNPDALLYDNFSNRIFIFNHSGGSATVLEAASGKVAGTVELGGDVEAGVSDEQGTIFVNVEDKHEVVSFDAKSLKIKNRWSVAPGEEPTGLAIDRDHHRLFSVCHNKLMLVLNSDNGQIIAQVPIGGGVDGVVFDDATQLAISSNGEGFLTLVHEDSPASFKVVQTVPTERGARTIALDPKSHHVFVTTAKLGPAPAATAENPHPRPSIVPDSFMVLEFGK